MHFTLKYLQQKVSSTFDRKINTASDCEKLAIDILKKTQVSISSQTLRRFFNIIPTKSHFSKFTLDVLSRYCGYKDFSTFVNIIEIRN